MLKTTRIIAALILCAITSFANAQTYTGLTWGLDRTSSPYKIGINLNGSWYGFGQITSGGSPTPYFPATFCSSSQWITASSGVPACSQPTALDVLYTPSGTGAVARTIAAKFNSESRTILDFNAKCDGSTDDSAAFAATATATGGVINVPYSSSGCVINSSVTLPSGSAVVGIHGFSGAAKIKTTSDIDTFTTGANASNITIHGLSFTHSGNGKIINFQRASSVDIADNNFTASNAIASSDMVYAGGSNTRVEGNYFTNSRTSGGWALNIERNASTPGSLLINVTVAGNNAAGAGKGFRVGMELGTTRPEGLLFTNNHLILTGGANLKIDDALYVTVIGNTVDLGNTNGGIHLNPQYAGLSDIAIIGNWMATPSDAITGKCLNINPGASSSVVKASVIGNKFNTCGYGVWTNTILTANLQIIGNSFTTMGTMAILANNVTDGLIISGNVCRACSGNFTLADGPSGGPVILGGNKWDNANTSSITQTTASNWAFYPDIGRRSINTASAVLNLTSCPLTVNVAHGLAATPSLLRTFASLSLPAAGAATVTNPNAVITAVDASNVTVSVGCTALGVSGNVNVNVNASL